MPYVTYDDSKAVKRIAEIEQELQERKTELDEWLAASEPPSNAAAMAYRERACPFGKPAKLLAASPDWIG